MAEPIVDVNGAFVSESEARISVLDLAVLCRDGIGCTAEDAAHSLIQASDEGSSPFAGGFTSFDGAEAACAEYGKHPVDTGSFKFVEYRPQQHIELEANESCFRGAPQPETLTYRYIPFDATRDLAFRSSVVSRVDGPVRDLGAETGESLSDVLRDLVNRSMCREPR